MHRPSLINTHSHCAVVSFHSPHAIVKCIFVIPHELLQQKEQNRIAKSFCHLFFRPIFFPSFCYMLVNCTWLEHSRRSNIVDRNNIFSYKNIVGIGNDGNCKRRNMFHSSKDTEIQSKNVLLLHSMETMLAP